MIQIGKAYVYSETHEDKHITKNEFETKILISSETMQSVTHDNEKEVDETVEKKVSYK